MAVGYGPCVCVVWLNGCRDWEGNEIEIPVDSEGRVTVKVTLEVRVKRVSKLDDSVQVAVRGILEKLGVKPVVPGVELLLVKPIGSPTAEEEETELPVDSGTVEVIVVTEMLPVPWWPVGSYGFGGPYG